MLKQFDEFQKILDSVMVQAFGKRIVLYGYGRSGRFIQWYAEYYHSLIVDYIITEDWSSNIPYEFPLFRNTLLTFDYKDVSNAIVWLAVPDRKNAIPFLEKNGYIKDETYFDFYELVYGKDVFVPEDVNENIFRRKKTGYRDVQFMEWLEYKYGCNFVTAIEQKYFTGEKAGHAPYMMFDGRIIYPLLDRCHISGSISEDAIFDFGCGKGGSIVSFLEYGFGKVGGVEYEQNIFQVLQDNMRRLGVEDKVSLIQGDAALVTTELDDYNWFYFFDPFTENILEQVLHNILDSIERRQRKTYIILINPHASYLLKKCGFVLTNQFEIVSRQRVVDVFTNQI